MRYGVCTNQPANCAKARSRELMPMASPDTRCPEPGCGKPLLPAPGGVSGRPASSQRGLLYGAGALILLLLGGIGFLVHDRGATKGDVASSQATTTPASTDGGKASVKSGATTAEVAGPAAPAAVATGAALPAAAGAVGAGAPAAAATTGTVTPAGAGGVGTSTPAAGAGAVGTATPVTVANSGAAAAPVAAGVPGTAGAAGSATAPSAPIAGPAVTAPLPAAGSAAAAALPPAKGQPPVPKVAKKRAPHDPNAFQIGSGT